MVSSQADLMAAAFDVFRKQGYASATLEDVARTARVEPATVRAQYPDKSSLFGALLAAYSPVKEMDAALESVEGDTADEILRDAMRRLVRVIEDNRAFLDLALIDAEVNNGAAIAGLGMRLFPKAAALFHRLKGTKQLRPVSDVILARTLVAMLMGFVISELAMPQLVRMAARLLPQRAWLDGMVDLMLYGVLEDDSR